MIRPVAKAVLDLLFPPLCIGCRANVGEAGFCAACWSAIAFLDGPGCACCGLPFPVALDSETLCAACLAKPPAFDSARAILAYDDNSRGAILALKHADRLDLVPGFACWLGRTGRALLETSDVVVPVPLHPLRLWRRRYNQSAELARRGAVLTDVNIAIAVSQVPSGVLSAGNGQQDDRDRVSVRGVQPAGEAGRTGWRHCPA